MENKKEIYEAELNCSSDTINTNNNNATNTKILNHVCDIKCIWYEQCHKFLKDEDIKYIDKNGCCYYDNKDINNNDINLDIDINDIDYININNSNDIHKSIKSLFIEEWQEYIDYIDEYDESSIIK